MWSFSVEPFWWQRRSVQVLAGLLLLGGLVALYRLLLQQLQASNLRLARRVDEATFDLQAKTVHLQALNQERPNWPSAWRGRPRRSSGRPAKTP